MPARTGTNYTIALRNADQRYHAGDIISAGGTPLRVVSASADELRVEYVNEPVAVPNNWQWADPYVVATPFDVDPHVPRRRRPKRVMITGSRTWTDEDKIRAALSGLPEGSTIVHGNARGADKIADRIARELGFEVEIFRADWRGEGRSAGIRRNIRMIESGVQRVIAFWDGESRGTAHAIRAAHDHDRIPTMVVYPTGINDER